MTTKLNGTAEYITEGDVILISFFIFDDADSHYHPELVKSGEFRLMRNEILCFRRNFDARFGNADGQFHFDVAHPPQPDMILSVSVTLFNSTILELTIPVSIEVDTKDATTPPLVSQPQVIETTYGIVRG
jgi:hypothetical protein